MGITIVVIFVFGAKQIVYNMYYCEKYFAVYFQTSFLIYVKHDIVQLLWNSFAKLFDWDLKK